MEAQPPIGLRMLYLSCARIPSEKAHTYQILKMCESFSWQGMKVTLLYQRRNNKQLEARAGDIFTYYALRTQFALKRLLCLDSALLERIHASLWFYVLTATYLCAAALYLLRHRKAIDIIYCRDIFSLALLGMLRPVLRRPVFYEAHVFPRKLTRFHVRCLKKMDGIVALTGQLRAWLVQHGVQQVPIAVAHDGVDLHRFSNAQRTGAHMRAQMEIPEESILIGYVGRFVTMEQEKGIKDLLAALHHLPEYQSLVYMAFIGGPMHHVPAYHRIIDELRLDRLHFRFYDLVPVNDVAAYLAACDIVAMPFPWTSHYAYHMSPLKMFEYMAAEKPILATRLPSIMEVLTDGENAVLVEPNNPEALARGIRRIIEDKAFSQHISKRARQDVLHYTWERRAHKIAQFMMDNLPSDAPKKPPVTVEH